MCPVQDAPPEGPGSTSGCGLQPNDSPFYVTEPAARYLVGLIGRIDALSEAIRSQTEQIGKLASVTGDAIDAMLAEREQADGGIEPLIPVSMSTRR